MEDIVTSKKKAVKTKKVKRYQGGEVETGDNNDPGFLMALLEDPIGRKLVLFTGFAWIVVLMWLLGELWWVMPIALLLTGLIVYPILHYFCQIDLKFYFKVLLLGSVAITKKE